MVSTLPWQVQNIFHLHYVESHEESNYALEIVPYGGARQYIFPSRKSRRMATVVD